MRGSIRERSPGHWAIILDQRAAATGKRSRTTSTAIRATATRLLSRTELSGGRE
jgi:hypothetical protein